MDYIRNWRRYHAEVDALAQLSDQEQEFSPSLSDTAEEVVTENNDFQRQGGSQNSDDSYSDNYQSESDNNYEFNDFDSEHDRFSDSDDSDNYHQVNEEEDCFQEHVPNCAANLAGWATTSKCTRSSLNQLLDILRQEGLRLPKDSRTLLQNPRSITTIKKCGGDYLYLGLESGLLKVISENLQHFKRIENLELSISIDGVPLFKSSSVQLWPILCSVKQFEPFVVAVYCGDTKPNSVDEYLFDFLSEITNLQQNGINMHDGDADIGQFKVLVSAFICDAPARSFLKCTKSHNGYYSCERCVIKGRWCQRRVIYDIGEHLQPARTEQGFKNFEYQDHQIKQTPLIDAGLSCIKSFPLDYMHLVCLGIVKRILLFLKQGPRECRLSHQQIKVLSDKLSYLNGKMPREFARQPRSLYYLDKWKATEFRQFLLYTGPLVLRSVVPERLFKHFLTLTVAMSILLEPSDDFRNLHLDYARQLLIYFVRTSPTVYGDIFPSYNVHSLIHIADDVEHYGSSLNQINAFKYENYLHKLKKSVRSAQNPIAQVGKRIVEMDKSKCRKSTKSIHVYVSKKKKDSCFLLANGKFAFVKEKRENKRYLCDVISQSHLENFFKNPCDSKLLNIVIFKSNTYI
ncbi:uncharacterized protein LOC134702069 isoform X1 [Mytilus trossulus]|uniref:uncharacterized protein LOC134702069 isoform X1 n=1 Tax=Mytilus trossulus TaxID=6551 RepID=UPI003007E8E0